MVAFDAAGNISRPATTVQVTTPGLPTPAGVRAVDGIGHVVVTWGAVEDETLIGYDVFRSTRSDDGYVRLQGTEGGSFTTGRTSYLDSNLAGGDLFFYRVRAVGREDAVSELSTFVSAEAQDDEVPPGAPGNLAAVPDVADFGHITVSWNVPQRDADGGQMTGLSGYAVFRSEETMDSFFRIATVTEPRYEDTGLEESSTYFYTVVAFDESGNESGRAVAVRVRTQGEDRVGPDSPQNVSAVADESVTDRIVVRWSAPTTDADGEQLTGLAGFVLFRSEGGARVLRPCRHGRRRRPAVGGHRSQEPDPLRLHRRRLRRGRQREPIGDVQPDADRWDSRAAGPGGSGRDRSHRHQLAAGGRLRTGWL
jgi:fibronectin type 3 domain-containing protein